MIFFLDIICKTINSLVVDLYYSARAIRTLDASPLTL